MFIRLFAACCAVVLLAGCATFHHYDPYYGQVIDAATGEPIEGAAVLAVYYTQSYGLAGSNLEFLDTQEVLTDEKGEFEVPSLISATFRPFQSFDSWAWITIFKPGYAGYGCFPVHQDVIPKEQPFSPNQKKTIGLPKLAAREERLKYLSCYPSPSVPADKYSNLLRLIENEINNLTLPSKNN